MLGIMVQCIKKIMLDFNSYTGDTFFSSGATEPCIPGRVHMCCWTQRWASLTRASLPICWMRRHGYSSRWSFIHSRTLRCTSRSMRRILSSRDLRSLTPLWEAARLNRELLLQTFCSRLKFVFLFISLHTHRPISIRQSFGSSVKHLGLSSVSWELPYVAQTIVLNTLQTWTFRSLWNNLIPILECSVKILLVIPYVYSEILNVAD